LILPTTFVNPVAYPAWRISCRRH